MIQLLFAHWHCILPAAAILIGMALMNRDGKKNSPQNRALDFRTNDTQNDEE